MELQLLWGGCCDFRDHGIHPHRLPRPVSDSTHGTDTTEPNAWRLVYLARWNTKTNKQDKQLISFLFTFDPDTQQADTVTFSEFSVKIVQQKKSPISKPSSVFDKLGLRSKYRGGSISAHTVEKNETSQGMPKLNHSGNRHPQPGREKEGIVN